MARKPDLRQNAEIVLELMKVQYSRNVVLSWDETVCWPVYALCKDHRGEFYIGGGDSHERIPAGSVDAKDLRRDRLAQTVVAYLLHLVCHYRMQPPTPVSQA